MRVTHTRTTCSTKLLDISILSTDVQHNNIIIYKIDHCIIVVCVCVCVCVCVGTTTISTGTVRLVSSSYPSGGSSGRLEIYYNGQWGTVCDDGFGPTDADVVCRQLGYQRASRYGSVGSLGYVHSCCSYWCILHWICTALQLLFLSYSRGTGTIWLTNVRCTSFSTSLASCGHSGYGNTQSCYHSEDVAISCTLGKN